jgi:hypothetical protein
MPSFSSLSDPKAYHIITYGTLLGSNLFQTFLAGPVAFKALPRPSFSVLQQAIFPPYFTFQTALPIILALTWPGEKLASVGGAVARRNAGLSGLLADENRWIALIPVVTMFATSLLNLVLLGPATTKVMRERKHQGKSHQREWNHSWRHGALTYLSRCRNKRWQEVLRRWSQIAGDAASQLGLYEVAWCLVTFQRYWSGRYARLRLYTCREIVMVILPNLVQQLDFVERRVHRSSRWSHYDQNYLRIHYRYECLVDLSELGGTCS